MLASQPMHRSVAGGMQGVLSPLASASVQKPAEAGTARKPPGQIASAGQRRHASPAPKAQFANSGLLVLVQAPVVKSV